MQRSHVALPHGGSLFGACINCYLSLEVVLLCFALWLLAMHRAHAFAAVFKREDKEQWTDRHLGGLLVVGRGNGFSRDHMKHTLQADPTAILDEVSLSLADSLENLFTPSLVWKEKHPHRWLLFSCHSRWGFLCSFLHYPQVKPRLAAKKHIPELERN